MMAVLENFPVLQFEDPAAQRQWFAERVAEMPSVDLPDGIEFDEIVLQSARGEHGIPVRRYRSETAETDGPIIVWIHGGGFCIGTAAEDEGLCVFLARNLSAVVLSIEYRLAPEFPFPAGFDDCWDVLTAVLTRSAHVVPGDNLTGPVLIGGGSAGACLASVLAIRARDEGLPAISTQFLVSPFLDPAVNSEAAVRFGNAAVFDSADAVHCWRHYLGADRDNPPQYSTPLVTNDLANVAPAYVVVAGNDCLRDDGIQYARALMSSSVDTELHVVPGVPHGFTGVAPQAVVSRRIRQEILDVLTAHVARVRSQRTPEPTNHVDEQR